MGDAAWCLAAIAQHGAALAESVADCGSLPLFALCLKEPSLPLRRITLSCLGCIGQHSLQLATILRKEGLLEAAIPFLKHRDLLLRRHVCRFLAVCVQHMEDISWFPQDA